MFLFLWENLIQMKANITDFFVNFTQRHTFIACVVFWKFSDPFIEHAQRSFNGTTNFFYIRLGGGMADR
jgi:hypothetical protein